MVEEREDNPKINESKKVAGYMQILWNRRLSVEAQVGVYDGMVECSFV